MERKGTWEWRYFVPSRLPPDSSAFAGKRHDIYWPAREDVGVKLRNVSSTVGLLELKVRTEVEPAAAGKGSLERWHKRTIGRFPSTSSAVDPAAAKALAASGSGVVADLFGDTRAPPLPAAVSCKKIRTLNATGEVTDCLFTVDLLHDDGSMKKAGVVQPPRSHPPPLTSTSRRLPSFFVCTHSDSRAFVTIS